jgi:hypothetical protein
MKIFLHIGMPKTGSTTIQRTLLLNKSRLRRAGVYYAARTNALYGLVTGTDKGPALRIPTRCHTMIISDERMFNRVRTPDHAQMIADTLREVAPEIHLVSYVRREDEVFVSAYFTRLLMGRSERLQDLPLNPVQTYKRLKNWNKAFRKKNMILRRFGRSYLEDGLVSDFAKTVGIDHLPLEDATVANSSPRTDVLEIIRLLNETRGDGPIDRYPLKALARVIGFSDPVGLSAEKRSVLIDKATEHNRRLSESYFGGETIFDHPIEDNEPKWPAIGIDELTKIGTTMAKLHKVPTGRPPKQREEGLEWIRALAQKCANTPNRYGQGEDPLDPLSETAS